MKIVTSGFPYIDIDAYSGCVAYAALLKKQGFQAEAVSTSRWNESITKTIRSWQTPLITKYIPSAHDTYTLIDVSDPKHFDTFVDINRVEKVIDHHPGFESYWQEKIGTNVRIEFIGAVCTQVYELWKMVEKLNEMSSVSASLLVCGILDNTLNFGAKVTTQRDVVAYKELLKIAGLPKEWANQYFMECQASVVADVVTAIKNDTKVLIFHSFVNPLSTGQLVVWDGRMILDAYGDVLIKNFQAANSEWFMNLVSVGEGKSYFLATSTNVQQWLSGLLKIQFTGPIAAADRLWLRKEIIQQDIVTKKPDNQKLHN